MKKVHKFFQNEDGRELRFKTDYDLSNADDMVLIFKDPDGREIRKAFADGVQIGVADITDNDLGQLLQNFYFTYEIEPGLLNISGDWQLFYEYQEGVTNIPEFVGSIKVRPMGSYQGTVPTNRILKFPVVPTLTIGDVFMVQGQLLVNDPSQPIDISAATSVRAAIVDLDGKEKLTAEQTLTELNNDWNHGIVLVSIPDSITSLIDTELKIAQLEIEVTLSSGAWTWFAAVRIVKGEIV